MSPKLKNTLTVVVAVGAAAAGGTAIAAAGSNGGGNTGRGSGYGPPRSNETTLTGTTADKVEAAALARVPGGTIVRVETDDGGVYEAHVRKADGTEVEVKVNKAFEVTEVVERGAGGPRAGHGPGGHRGGPGRGSGPAELTGTTAAKVKAAALARVKGGTVLFTHRDRDGAYEAHVRRADGTEVEVEVNKAFKVTAVEQHDHRRRP